MRKSYLTLYTDEQGTDQHTLTPELESALDYVQSLPGLTAAEQALYQELLRGNSRLEQEKLPPQIVAAALLQLHS